MDIGKWLGKWETDGESVYFHESLMGDKLFTFALMKVIKALQEAGLHG